MEVYKSFQEFYDQTRGYFNEAEVKEVKPKAPKKSTAKKTTKQAKKPTKKSTAKKTKKEKK